MKKWLIPVIVIGIILYALYSWGKGFNNEAVVLQEDAKTKWSNVESAYQRRSDLIGNLVSTVKNAAEYEKGTLTAVIEARAKATSTNIDANNLTPEMMAQFQQAQSGLAGALSKLMVVVEKYPELQANKNFLELQSQLEGTENRINTERNRFNEVATEYRDFIETFPKNLFASVFGFDALPLFKSSPGSENAPDIDFDFGFGKMINHQRQVTPAKPLRPRNRLAILPPYLDVVPTEVEGPRLRHRRVPQRLGGERVPALHQRRDHLPRAVFKLTIKFAFDGCPRKLQPDHRDAREHQAEDKQVRRRELEPQRPQVGGAPHRYAPLSIGEPNRYPAPTTVWINVVSNGLSTFLRRADT